MPETSPLIFLYGNDEYAISRRLNEMQAKYDKEGMNTSRLEAATVSQEELNKAVNSMPFLSEKRLVFLENPSRRSSLPAARQKLLESLLAAPPTTLVVLHELVEQKELNTHWLIKRAGKGELKAEAFMMPRQWQMQKWILDETKRQKGQMEAPAAARLADMTGEDTRLAAQEITKLLTYVNFARPITTTDVEAVSTSNAEGNVFALVDAMASGNGKDAQKVLHQLMDKEDPAAFWGLVIRQFRLLLQAKEIQGGGGSRLQIEKLLGIREYEAGKISSQAQGFTLPRLEGIYHRLLEIDEGTKSSHMTLDLALDMLVVEVTQR